MSDESHAAPDEGAVDTLDAPEPVEAGEVEETAGDAAAAAETDEGLPTAAGADAAPDAETEPPPSAEDADAGSPPDADAAESDDAARPEGQPAPDKSTAAEADAAEPFTYKADGTEFEVPGAEVKDGEIRLTREQWQRHIQPQLADRRRFIEERRRLHAQAEQAGERHKGELEKWQQIGQALEQVLSAPDEQLIQRIAQLKRQWPQLKLQAERAALEDERKTLTSQQETRQREAQAEQLRPQLRQHLDGAVRKVAEEVVPDAGLDDEALGRVSDKLMRLWNAGLFFEADEALAAEMGVPVGTPMVRTDWIEDELRDRAELLSAVRERQKKAAEAKRKNDAALGRDKKEPAPTVSAKGSPAPGEKTPDFSKMDQDEYDRYLANKYQVPT